MNNLYFLHLFFFITIIRDLDESGKVVKPSSGREWTNLYLYYMKNAKKDDGSVNYRLLEMGMFGSYKNTFDSNRNNDSLFLFFTRKSQTVNGN